MLGIESSRDERTREEIMYWRSLNPFFQVHLHPGFRSGFEIPLYFSENVKGKLPHKVVLKGPGVDFDTWEVQLKTRNETTWVVGEGWEDFVDAFCLEENDTLVFKYKNNSYFKVRVFNGKTSCERESSRFVIKSVSHQQKGSCSLVQKTSSLKKQETEISLAISGSEKEKKYNDDQKSMKRESIEKKVLIQVYDDSDDEAPISTRIVKRKDDSGICNKSSEQVRAVKQKTGPEVDYICSPPDKCSQEKEREIQRASQRAKEIRKAWKRAKNIQMGIPKRWWTEVIKSKCSKCLKLRVKGKDEYDPRLYTCRYDNSNCSGRITTGWKKFVEENSLCQHDCCVFSLAKPFEDNNEIFHLEVEIIHALISKEDSEVAIYDMNELSLNLLTILYDSRSF